MHEIQLNYKEILRNLKLVPIIKTNDKILDVEALPLSMEDLSSQVYVFYDINFSYRIKGEWNFIRIPAQSFRRIDHKNNENFETILLRIQDKLQKEEGIKLIILNDKCNLFKKILKTIKS